LPSAIHAVTDSSSLGRGVAVGWVVEVRGVVCMAVSFQPSNSCSTDEFVRPHLAPRGFRRTHVHARSKDSTSWAAERFPDFMIVAAAHCVEAASVLER
jgi:hypothetical protein